MQYCEEPSSVLFGKLLIDTAQPFFSLPFISIYFFSFISHIFVLECQEITFSQVDNKSQPSKFVSLFICRVDLTVRSNSSPDFDP